LKIIGDDKRPVGRPRTTVDDLPVGWQDAVIACGEEGGSAVEMRCLLGIGESAWRTLLEDDSEFRGTVKKAKALCEVWWERQGRRMATGADGNATVWIFNMKNRFGWHDKQAVDHTSSDGSLAPTRIVIEAAGVNSEDKPTS
jgi:hypothetical protein